MKLGIFGGTFDPIHNGHLEVASAVRSKLKLEQIMFVVAADQWMRTNPPVASPKARFEMLQLALRGSRYFCGSDIDIKRRGPIYTVDTLEQLIVETAREKQFHLIVGSDAAKDMNRWRHSEKLQSLAQIVVVGRPGECFEELNLSQKHPAKDATFITGPMIDISSSIIRYRFKNHQPVIDMVPTDVLNYIEQNGLYSQVE